MVINNLAWIWPVLFYLLGSVPTGYLMGRSRGIDIRQHGSGNIGATNVGRVIGRNWGLAAFACDFLKGFLPLYLLRIFEFPGEIDWRASLLLVLCGLAAIMGHNFTPWLGFKGGKGVATTGGVLCALMPWVFAATFSLWFLAVLLTRFVSLGSVLAAFALPLAAAFFYPREWSYFGFALFGGIMVVWRHRSNVRRLAAGTEPKLGSPVAKLS
jgi:glycerol-3-phosphate acyltransferase PlsY